MMSDKKPKLLFMMLDMGGGGAERVLANLLNELDLNKYDITLYLIFNHGVNLQRLKPGIKVKYFFNRPPFRGISNILRVFSPEFLFKCMIKEKYDVLIAYMHHTPTRILGGCHLPGIKKYAWVHTAEPEFNCYKRLSEAKKIYESYDGVAFVSEYSLNCFKKHNWDITPSVVNNTLDVESIKSASRESLNLNIKANILNLCSVGRLSEEKGYLRLIKILGRLNREGYSKWHFYLLGSGEQREILEQTVKEDGIEDKISMLGFDPNPHKYVAKMDMFVCSSYTEGYSTAVTEAVILGIPVITTDCSGMSEIFGDSGCGMIVDNSDDALYAGLKHLLSHPEQIKKMREAAAMRSNYFSTERTVKQFEDFISK